MPPGPKDRRGDRRSPPPPRPGFRAGAAPTGSRTRGRCRRGAGSRTSLAPRCGRPTGRTWAGARQTRAAAGALPAGCRRLPVERRGREAYAGGATSGRSHVGKRCASATDGHGRRPASPGTAPLGSGLPGSALLVRGAERPGILGANDGRATTRPRKRQPRPTGRGACPAWRRTPRLRRGAVGLAGQQTAACARTTERVLGRRPRRTD